jgi:hypothetical protein
MKDIHSLKLEKYEDTTKYKLIDEGIYQALFDGEDGIPENGDYVAAFSFTLEEGEDSQYPLEDILDKYYAHVSNFIQYDPDNPVIHLELCTGDDLDSMRKLKEIVGKRVYNKEYTDKDDGKTYIKFTVE